MQQQQHSEVFLRIMERRRRRRIRKTVILVVSGIIVAGVATAVIVSHAQTRPETKATEKETETDSITYIPTPTVGVTISPTEAEPTTKPAYQTMIHSKDWSAEESYLLAKIAMAEAEGEDTKGKALVILTVLNRVWSDLPYFPDTIEEVIFQDGAFTPIANGRWDRVEPDADCWAALELVQVEHWDESYGALYFERTTEETTWHTNNLKELFVHGNHTFYKERD